MNITIQCIKKKIAFGVSIFIPLKKIPLEKISNYLFFVGLTSNSCVFKILTNGFAKLNDI